MTLVSNFTAHGKGVGQREQTLLGEDTAKREGVTGRTELVGEGQSAKGALGLESEARCHAAMASQVPTWHNGGLGPCRYRLLLAPELQFDMADSTGA